MKQLAGITDLMDMNLSKLQEMVKNNEGSGLFSVPRPGNLAPVEHCPGGHPHIANPAGHATTVTTLRCEFSPELLSAQIGRLRQRWWLETGPRPQKAKWGPR